MKKWQRSLLALCAFLALFGGAAYAQAPGAPPVEFPYTGNRTAVWIVAQLHILFAAFILGAPIFVVISEWLGYRKQDPRYDRLAKERSEERRVGKECRYRWSRYHEKKKRRSREE